MMEMITRERALVIISNHGFGPTDQTAIDTRQPLAPYTDYNGHKQWSYPWCESGTSFDEMLGVHSEYSKRLVLDWLGY